MLDNDLAATQGAPDSESVTETTPAATEDTNAKGAEREAPEAASDDDPGEQAEAPEAKTEEAHADDADDDADRRPNKWVQKRIDSLTKARHEAERRAADMERRAVELEAMLRQSRGEEQPAELPDTLRNLNPAQLQQALEAEAERRATAKASQIANEREFTAACNRVFEEGTKAYGDAFVKARDTLAQNFGEVIQARPDFLQAVTELPNGHEVFHALGRNLDEADRILSLPPVKMAMELSRMSDKVGKKPAPVVSKAPAPVTRVEGMARAEKDLSKVSMEEYARIREKQIAERMKSRGY